MPCPRLSGQESDPAHPGRLADGSLPTSRPRVQGVSAPGRAPAGQGWLAAGTAAFLTTTGLPPTRGGLSYLPEDKDRVATLARAYLYCVIPWEGTLSLLLLKTFHFELAFSDSAIVIRRGVDRQQTFFEGESISVQAPGSAGLKPRGPASWRFCGQPPSPCGPWATREICVSCSHPTSVVPSHGHTQCHLHARGTRRVITELCLRARWTGVPTSPVS